MKGETTCWVPDDGFELCERGNINVYKLYKVRLPVEFPDDGFELCQRGNIIMYKLWKVRLPVEFPDDGFELYQYENANIIT